MKQVRYEIMDLKDILKKSESKLLDKKYSLRKAIITRGDRPYLDTSSNFNGRQTDDEKGTIGGQNANTLKHDKQITNGRQLDIESNPINLKNLSGTETELRAAQIFMDAGHLVEKKVIQNDDTSKQKVIDGQRMTNGGQIEDSNQFSNGRDTDKVNQKWMDDNKGTISIQKVDNAKFDNLLRKTWNVHGNEKKLYLWIESQCQITGNITNPITKDVITKETGISVTCLKKTIDRLIEKRLISIYDSQSGRFGWRIFSLID